LFKEDANMADKSKRTEEKSISLEEATQEVELVSRRLGLLHLCFARTIVDELGEVKGKKLILKAVKKYGTSIGEEGKKKVLEMGLEPTPENFRKVSDIPKFGMLARTEKLDRPGEKGGKAYGCALSKVWKEYDEEELGRLYCYVDIAKYMGFNPDYKLSHLKAVPDGDDCCELVVRRTSEKEREDFASDDKDWSYMDR
jgi:hypothetical protein